jgi:dolichol-phosphate mannosyltransferase
MIGRSVSVVIPAYNEEGNIDTAFSRVSAALKDSKLRYEIIFVDDGSTDNTALALRRLARQHSEAKVITFSRNFGHQVALTAGIDAASGDAVITMDCDLQDPPELIPKLLREWRKGSQIVYARRSRRHDGFLKRSTAACYYTLLDMIADIKMPREVGDFRLMDRQVVDALKQMPERARYLRGMIHWTGFRQAFVDFERPERANGATHYSMRKMLGLARNGIWSFSSYPLQLSIIFSAISLLAGIGILAYLAYGAATGAGYSIIEWSAPLLLILLGLVFFQLWVIGEYISRIYDEEKGRPLYVVSERRNFSPAHRRRAAEEPMQAS